MKKTFTLLTFTILLGVGQLMATHINSAEINAQHLSGNQYLVSLRLLTDCAAISAPPSVSLSFNNGTSSFNRTINQTNSSTAIGMNYSCACWAASTACNGGSLPGNNYVIYSDTVTLPASATWTASYSTCCRYSVINIANASSLGIYVETQINQTANPSNSTPFFPLTGKLYIHHNDTFQMDLSAMDYDNDSITYALIDIMGNSTQNATYQPGYSGASPIIGFTVDALTGILNYNGTAAIGNYYLAIKATEYDRVTGLIKSTIIRDFGLLMGAPGTGAKYLFEAPTSNGFSNSNNSITLCGASANTVDLSFTSTLANVNLWSDISWKYPGVTFSNSLGLTSTMTISIPANINQTQLEFYVQASGDSGYFTNMSFEKFTINFGGFSTSGNQTVCLGDSVQMSVSSFDPNPTYVWTYISGTPIDTVSSSPTYSFSCTNCANPIIIPTVTSTYVANSFPNSCGQPDTFTITVIQPLSLLTNLFDTICQGDSILLAVDGGVNGKVWKENGLPLNQTGDSIFVSPISTANYEVSNANQQCGSVHSIGINVIENVIAGPDVTVCLGDSVQISATNLDSLTWSPSSSLSCLDCAMPWAMPNQSTMYTVSNNANGCTSSDSVLVDVLIERYISGVALQPNNAPLALTKTLLIEYNSVDSTVMIMDSLDTDVTGAFMYTTTSTTHYVKVIPDSATYPNQIPTYYGNEALFLNSSAVNTNACDTSNITITTLSDPNPGGPGFIYGNVYQGAGKTDAAGDPAVGLRIILVNSNGNEVAYSETNGNGKFSFPNLANGNYELFMDNVNAQNQLAPTIMVDEFTQHLVYNFKLESGVLIPTTVTSVNDLKSVNLLLYPNPAKNQLQIIGISSYFEYSIVGIDGRTYLANTGNGSSIIDISELPKGAYFLKTTTNSTNFINRFIKN
jgi:hypothetical protein